MSARHLAREAGILAGATLAMSLTGVVAADEPLDHAAVLAAMPALVAGGAPAFLMHAIDESGEWSAAVGVADRKTGAPASPDAAFRIGSISKMFVAVTILKLVDDGLVDLDAPVSTYLPGLLARGNDITIRELLQHRSGLDTNEFGTIHGNTWYPAIQSTCRNDLDTVAVIKAADVQLFEPGTAFHYSNPGYMVLGLVIDKVTGQPYEQVIHDRIAEPLGLAHTSFQEGAPQWPGPFVSGYGDFLPGIKLHRNLTDQTDCKMSIFGAAGSGISTTRDLTTFLSALLHGDLLPDALLQQMLAVLPAPELGDGVDYGLGIIEESGCGTTIVGHGGTVWGYESNLDGSLDGTRIESMAVSIAPGPDAMWNAFSDVFAKEMCRTTS